MTRLSVRRFGAASFRRIDEGGVAVKMRYRKKRLMRRVRPLVPIKARKVRLETEVACGERDARILVAIPLDITVKSRVTFQPWR